MQIQEVRFMLPVQAYQFPADHHAFYEARIYRSVVGRFNELAEALSERPLAAGATRIGLWTCESPQPNEVCELIAYRSFEDRLKDHSQSPQQQAWLDSFGHDFLNGYSTLMLPIGISPVK